MGKLQQAISSAALSIGGGTVAGEYRAEQAYLKDLSQFNDDIKAVMESQEMGDPAIKEQEMSDRMTQLEEGMKTKEGVMERNKNQVSKKQQRKYTDAKKSLDTMRSEYDTLRTQHATFNERVQLISDRAEAARARLGLGSEKLYEIEELPSGPQRKDYGLFKRGRYGK